GRIAGELAELALDPADDPVYPARYHRMGAAHQHRRREGLVEDHRLILDLQDTGNGHADPAGVRIAPDRIGEPRVGDVDLLLDPQAGGGIDDRLAALNVTAGAVVMAVGDLDGVDCGLRHANPDDLAGGILRHVDR